MNEADVRTVMAHPTTMIGSDGVPAAGSKPHPRLYGCFPRVLGHYVRDEGVLDLATAIHRMTGMPAAKFRLVDRGVVRPGAFADLVVFDPATDSRHRDVRRPTPLPGGHPRGLRQRRGRGARRRPHRSPSRPRAAPGTGLTPPRFTP